MDEKDKVYLKKILNERIISNWNKTDEVAHDNNRIIINEKIDENNWIKGFFRNHDIELYDEVKRRF